MANEIKLNHMKKHVIYIAIFILATLSTACVDETGDIVHKGKIQLVVTTPEIINAENKDNYTIKAKFYREYNDLTVEAKLEIESISADGVIKTLPYDVEHGNWAVTQASLLDKSNSPVYLAVNKEDERAQGIEPDLLLPATNNVLDGQLTTFNFTLVDFKPKTDGGDITAKTALFYDFSGGKKYDKITLNGWTTVDGKVGADRGWSFNEKDGNNYAQASGFGGKEANYTSWMITPPLDLDATSNKIVSFKTAKAYWAASSQFKVYIMDGKDPSTASKIELSAVLAKETDADHAWIESGDIDLSAYAGVRYIAFYYYGEGTTGKSTSFRVDDFTYGDYVAPEEPLAPLTQLVYDFTEGTKGDVVNMSNWVTVNENPKADKQWSYAEFNTNKYAQMKAYKGTDATYTSWMISPPLDIDGTTNKKVTFKTAKAYWAETTQFKVYLLNGTDPNTAMKIELPAVLASQTDANHAWIESGEIDLSAYSGVKHIAFYYQGEGSTGKSTTFKVDDFKYGDYPGSAITGGTKDAPYTVQEAIGIQDGSKAWVQGYVVGFVVYGTPVTVTKDPANFSSDSNIAIAATADETDTNKMIYVQLSGSGSAARTQLGLATNGESGLGKQLKLNGTLSNYFGDHAGLKGISAIDQFEIIVN